MNIDEWIQYGIDQGYAEKFCYMHDHIPMTDDEQQEYDDTDICFPTLRIWLD